jgi:hypothetical protein
LVVWLAIWKAAWFVGWLIIWLVFTPNLTNIFLRFVNLTGFLFYLLVNTKFSASDRLLIPHDFWIRYGTNDHKTQCSLHILHYIILAWQ